MHSSFSTARRFSIFDYFSHEQSRHFTMSRVHHLQPLVVVFIHSFIHFFSITPAHKATKTILFLHVIIFIFALHISFSVISHIIFFSLSLSLSFLAFAPLYALLNASHIIHVFNWNSCRHHCHSTAEVRILREKGAKACGIEVYNMRKRWGERATRCHDEFDASRLKIHPYEFISNSYAICLISNCNYSQVLAIIRIMHIFHLCLENIECNEKVMRLKIIS